MSTAVIGTLTGGPAMMADRVTEALGNPDRLGVAFSGEQPHAPNAVSSVRIDLVADLHDRRSFAGDLAVEDGARR